MKNIINLTQHAASQEQIEAGVVPAPCAPQVLRDLLTFSSLPEREEIFRRAVQLAAIAEGFPSAMIGGAPYLMGPLEQALLDRGVTPIYAFSRRESVEHTAKDGSVVKTQVFRHLGFVGSSR